MTYSFAVNLASTPTEKFEEMMSFSREKSPSLVYNNVIVDNSYSFFFKEKVDFILFSLRWS